MSMSVAWEVRHYRVAYALYGLRWLRSALRLVR